MIRGVTFSKQSVSSNDDSHVYKVLLDGRKGKTRGCKMTFGVDDIYISDGYFFAANRLIEISSTETITTPVVSTGTTYCRLVFEIDMTKTNTASEFNQGYFKVISSTTAYPEITQEDFEEGGNVYQLPFAKFTKTVSGIGSFVAELETVTGANEANKAIYVAMSGSDAAGDGTQNNPFASIQKAIDSISKDLNNKEITIVVETGTYNEDVKISGFYGGMLRVNFNNVTITSLTIADTNITIGGINLTVGGKSALVTFYVNNGANVICQVPLTVNGGLSALHVNNGSRFLATQNVTINTALYAVLSEHASIVYIYTLKGTGSDTGVLADSAFVILHSIAAGIASTQYATESGGRIYMNAQTSIPNY